MKRPIWENFNYYPSWEEVEAEVGYAHCVLIRFKSFVFHTLGKYKVFEQMIYSIGRYGNILEELWVEKQHLNEVISGRFLPIKLNYLLDDHFIWGMVLNECIWNAINEIYNLTSGPILKIPYKKRITLLKGIDLPVTVIKFLVKKNIELSFSKK
jgi:hypothetical protein